MATDRKAEVTWQGDLIVPARRGNHEDRARRRRPRPGIDESAFQQAADGARQNCPVSKALTGVPEISLTARLES
jgi:organic hydroperoxide reductase OsmC/OhrA